jgi:hypothetical protein
VIRVGAGRRARVSGVLAVGAALLILAGCGRGESEYSSAIQTELSDWADMIVAVTAQSDTTAVVETSLSSYEQLDLGPALAMCMRIEDATSGALDGLAAVIIESRSGDTLTSCFAP